jgi:hypothetical protein
MSFIITFFWQLQNLFDDYIKEKKLNLKDKTIILDLFKVFIKYLQFALTTRHNKETVKYKFELDDISIYSTYREHMPEHNNLYYIRIGFTNNIKLFISSEPLTEYILEDMYITDDKYVYAQNLISSKYDIKFTVALVTTKELVNYTLLKNRDYNNDTTYYVIEQDISSTKFSDLIFNYICTDKHTGVNLNKEVSHE